ncbi:peptidase inhibitor family I36 protein [Streptomyces bullii]|uniref:Peptidase inhibitor family I36 protein n=1 Tax=Streptomyces bullii TaxID=349910 RepID=A0ABW0UL66_9ACTN
MRVKTALAAAMIVGAGLFTTQGVANAALSDCNSNNMCMWGNNDFRWMIGERAHGSGTWANLSGDRNDEMDSWANRSASHTGCMAEHSNGSGDRQSMHRNDSDNNVAPWNSDEISSWRTTNGC